MIKARYNSFVFSVIVFGVFFFLIIFIISVYAIYFNIDIFNFRSDTKSISPKIYLFASLLGLAIFTFITSKIKMISIDYLNQQIVVKNFITQQKINYNFSELDGYYDMAINHSGKMKHYSKAIGISKDRKIIFLIDSYYCSNLTEMRNGLSKLKYLGTDTEWEKQNF